MMDPNIQGFGLVLANDFHLLKQFIDQVMISILKYWFIHFFHSLTAS